MEPTFALSMGKMAGAIVGVKNYDNLFIFSTDLCPVLPLLDGLKSLSLFDQRCPSSP
jgi:hypothetical protein